MIGRVIVIGDVHGCSVELQDLLSKLQYRSEQDRVVCVGDLIDKGPDSLGVVQLAASYGWRLVMGNHDEKAVRYWRHTIKKLTDPKYKIPMQLTDDRRMLFDQLIHFGLVDNYLAKARPYVMLHPDWVIVHGGFLPNVPVAEQPEKQIIRLRYIDETGKMVSLTKDLKKPEGGIFWTDRWPGPFNVIYGHTAAHLSDVRVQGKTWGIDTGCAYGGKLTALVFDSFEAYPQIIQVQSRQAYAPYYEEE